MMGPASRGGRFARAAVLAVAMLAGRAASADVLIEYSATIVRSPFQSGDLAVGGTIAGQYDFDPRVTPYNRGTNYASYRFSHMSFSAGANAWDATGAVTLGVNHRIGIGLPDGTVLRDSDVYEVTGSSPIVGPTIEGFRPVLAALYLVDTDASIYSNANLPVDLPDPSLFEVKMFRLSFRNSSGSIPDLIGRIDVIRARAVPEPASLTLTGLMLPAALAIAWRRRRARGRCAPAA